jgi:hypothetical protein
VIKKILAWLYRLCGGYTEPGPRPPDWKKTLDDLSAENRSLSGEEIEWARQYERDELRSWARFPKNDEVFEATCDAEVSYLIDWGGPGATGGKGRLPRGTRIRVSVHAGDAEPIGVNATPLDEALIGERLIPEDDRSSSTYRGYGLSLHVAQLNREFALVQPVGVAS